VAEFDEKSLIMADEKKNIVQKLPRLKKIYIDKVIGELSTKFGYTNIMEAPRLTKIVINMGVGEGSRDIKFLDAATHDLAQITGQKPVVTRAKKSIANFKIREGMPVGCKVTLRGIRMYEFFDRLVNIAIPRIRDFRGVSPRSFDGRGSYTLGIREQLIFPEIDLDKVVRTQGMDITIVTSAKSDEEARELLRCLGMPFTAS
jgi:large subunit ribosomal protein L5